MKFKVEYLEDNIQKQLLYLEDECSFYMEDSNQNVDLELIINKIALQVSKNKIVELGGFCGLNKEMISNIQIPEYQKGILRIEHNLKYGFAYSVNDDIDYEYPVFINIESGWICIGNPKIKKNAVEFISNCVAVINDLGNFESLWLKPMNLPENLFL